MLNIVDTGKTNYETPKKSIFWPWPRFLWFLLTITLKRFTCSHQGQLNKIEVRKRVFYRNNKNEWGIIIIIIIIRSSLLGIPWHSPSTFLCLPLQLLVVQFCILCHPSIGQCRSFLGVFSADVHVLASRVMHSLLVLVYWSITKENSADFLLLDREDKNKRIKSN